MFAPSAFSSTSEEKKVERAFVNLAIGIIFSSSKNGDLLFTTGENNDLLVSK